MAMYSSYFMQASRLSRYVRTLWNYIFMGDREFGKGGPILAAKIGPGDRFWRRTDFFVTDPRPPLSAIGACREVTGANTKLTIAI